MFDANYPIHFVVGDGSDTYYSASGLQLNLNQNIALELGNRWENILFLQDTGSDLCVYNREGKHLEEYTKKTLGKSKLDVCRTKIFKALYDSRQRSKTAVIADLSAFCRLMKGNENSLQRMSGIMSNDRGILILLIPQTVDPALPYLTDPNGIFLQGNSNVLCPQIKYLNSTSAELFNHLSEGEQFKFMSELTPDVCNSLLICALLEQHDIFFSGNEIADCAEALYSLCTNKGFRKYAKLMENLSSMPKFSEIFEWLRQGKNLEKVFKLTEKLEEERNGRSLIDTVESLAGEPNKRQLIRRSDPLILDLCSIQYPPNWCLNADTDIKESLNAVQNKAFYPCAVRQNEEVATWLQSLIGLYRDALSKKDEQYLKDVLRVICFAADKLYTNNSETILKHKEAFETWITLSRKIVLERKTLHDQEVLLEKSASETLYYAYREQKVTVESFQKLYDETTGFITPMLNNQEEITLSQVTDILENLKKLARKAEDEWQITKTAGTFIAKPAKNEDPPIQEIPPPLPPNPTPSNQSEPVLLTREVTVQKPGPNWSDEEAERRKKEQRRRVRQERSHDNILGI